MTGSLPLPGSRRATPLSDESKSTAAPDRKMCSRPPSYGQPRCRPRRDAAATPAGRRRCRRLLPATSRWWTWLHRPAQPAAKIGVVPVAGPGPQRPNRHSVAVLWLLRATGGGHRGHSAAACSFRSSAAVSAAIWSQRPRIDTARSNRTVSALPKAADPDTRTARQSLRRGS